MAKSMRRISLILAASMVTIMVGACGNQSKKGDSGNTSSGSEQKENKPAVTLNVEVFDRSNAPQDGGTCDNNYMTNLINEKFGKPNNVTVKYVPVPRAQEVDKLSVLMAAGTPPDVCFTYDKNVYFNFAKSGLTDLTDMVNKSKNLKNFEDSIAKEVLYDGKMMAVAAKRASTGSANAFIRTDWLEKLNIPVPKTTDEWYQAMKAFKEKNPGNVDNVIPYGMFRFAANDSTYSSNLLLNSFVNASDEELQTLPTIMLPGYKDGVKFINKLYNEGLIDKEFALEQNDTKFKANLASGKVGSFTYNFDYLYSKNFGEILEALKKNVPDVKFEPIEVFKNSQGKYAKPAYPESGMYIMVPKASKVAQTAVDYLDWMSTVEAGKMLNFGVEGVHIKYENGIPVTIDDAKVKKDRWNAGDLAIIYNGFAENKEQYYKIMENNTSLYGNNAKLAASSLKMSEKDSFRDYYYPLFDRPIDSVTKYSGNLTKLVTDSMAKCIMAKPADFEKVYSDMVSEYLKNGGQQMIDDKKEAYKAMKK